MCLVFRDRRLTGREVDRSHAPPRQLPRSPQGLGCHIERDELAGHESGQDHLAIYLHNGNEYLESMLGAFKARVAPFNVNYRYVAEELRYLLDDARRDGDRRAQSQFAPTLAEVLPDAAAAARRSCRSPTSPGNDAAARRRLVRGRARRGVAPTSRR